MKKIFLFSIITLVATISESQVIEEGLTKLQGPYLGQKPPEMVPELFAPDVLKPETGIYSVHSSPSFSSDGEEVYITVMPPEGPFHIKYMKQKNRKWTKPIVVPFARDVQSFDSFFGNDDNTIFFKSATTRHNELVNTLWQVIRDKGYWEKPSELNPLFDGLAMGVSITNSGTIYFTLAKEGYGSHDIYNSQLKDGKYSLPEKLGPEINSSGDDWQPFIAPDESYLIFGRFGGKPNQEYSTLYISFKQSDGSWTEAKSMGDFINNGNAVWPYVSPDGKYFFFVSSRDNNEYFYKIYWVDSRIITNLRETL